jgi:hypothetical protein
MPAGRTEVKEVLRGARSEQSGDELSESSRERPLHISHANDVGLRLSGPQRLGDDVRADMEERFGFDFESVQVYSSGAAAGSAVAIEAHAYTIGHDVVFAPGRFSTADPAGRRLLAHELAHVVQQSRSGGAAAADLERDAQCAARETGNLAQTSVSLAGPVAVQRQKAPEPPVEQVGLPPMLTRVLDAMGLPCTSAEIGAALVGGMLHKLSTEFGGKRGQALRDHFASLSISDLPDLYLGWRIGLLEGMISPLTDMFGLLVLGERLLGALGGAIARARTAGLDLTGEAESLMVSFAGLVGTTWERLDAELHQRPLTIVRDILGLPSALAGAARGQAFEFGEAAGEEIIKSLEEVWTPKEEEEASQGFLATLQAAVGRVEARVVNTPGARLGKAVGKLVGSISIQVILFVFTDGIGNAIQKVGAAMGELASALGKFSKVAGAVVTGAAELVNLIGRAITGIEKVIGIIIGKALKPFEKVLQPLHEFMGSLKKFLQKLLGVAEKGGAEFAAETAAHAATVEAAPPVSVPLPEAAPPVPVPLSEAAPPAPVPSSEAGPPVLVPLSEVAPSAPVPLSEAAAPAPVPSSEAAPPPAPTSQAAPVTPAPSAVSPTPTVPAYESEKAFAGMAESLPGEAAQGPVVGQKLGAAKPRKLEPGFVRKPETPEERKIMETTAKAVPSKQLQQLDPAVRSAVEDSKLRWPRGKTFKDIAVENPIGVNDYHREWKASGTTTEFDKYVRLRMQTAEPGLAGETAEAFIRGAKGEFMVAPPGEVSARGIDLVTYQPGGRTKLIDNKAVSRTVGHVSALEENLPTNLDETTKWIKTYAKQPGVPAELEAVVVPQLEAAQAQIAVYIDTLPKPPDLRSAAVQKQFGKILDGLGIDRVVTTSAARPGVRISSSLAGRAFTVEP